MANSVVKILDEDSTSLILKLSPPKTIVSKAVIVYEGQIPNLAICIYEGSICIGKTKFDFTNINEAAVILLDQYNQGIAINENIEVLVGSKISILDKTIVSIVDAYKSRNIGKS